jgi:hypothetical protein
MGDKLAAVFAAKPMPSRATPAKLMNGAGPTRHPLSGEDRAGLRTSFCASESSRRQSPQLFTPPDAQLVSVPLQRNVVDEMFQAVRAFGPKIAAPIAI